MKPFLLQIQVYSVLGRPHLGIEYPWMSNSNSPWTSIQMLVLNPNVGWRCVTFTQVLNTHRSQTVLLHWLQSKCWSMMLNLNPNAGWLMVSAPFKEHRTDVRPCKLVQPGRWEQVDLSEYIVKKNRLSLDSYFTHSRHFWGDPSRYAPRWGYQTTYPNSRLCSS